VAVALENARLDEEVRRERDGRSSAAQGAGEADEASDRALATLSHDLRSPLNAIDSYAELIEMEILGPVSDRQREALGRIRMSGRHLLAVLENVLEMTRLSAGVVRIHASSVVRGHGDRRGGADGPAQRHAAEPVPPRRRRPGDDA
jgi:signal transduction histidine kinase